MIAASDAAGIAAAPRRALMIFGMHGSGTSLLRRVLALRDPDTEPREGQDAAALQSVAELNDHVLKRLGSSWEDPRPIWVRGPDFAAGKAELFEVVEDEFLDIAEQLITTGFARRARVVLDDPRLCLLRPLWDKAFALAGFRTSAVLMVRNPIEVAAAMKQRHDLAAPLGHQLWLHYNLAALAPGAAAPIDHVVSYDALLADKSRLVARLAQALELDAPAPDDRAAQGAAIRIDEFVNASLRHHAVAPQAVQHSPLVASATKRLHALLSTWDGTDPAWRRREAEEIGSAYDDMFLLLGRLCTVPAPQVKRRPPAPAAGPQRHVLVHYHLFKNAGTSFDEILKRSFGDLWRSCEFQSPNPKQHAQELQDLLACHPSALALSSHTLLPVPSIAGVSIFPVLFLRHPIDRLKSAYEFERTQKADTVGSLLARDTDFAGYLRARLASPHDRSCRDFHAYRLAKLFSDAEGSEEQRALAALERLPFVGLVEAFDRSIERLRATVNPIFPDFQAFSVRLNATRPPKDIEDKLAEIRDLLGRALYDDLVAANPADMLLYEKVRAAYAMA